ncbi:restriction endonuclease subunit S [Mitsuokella sp.]|uniref:restriction endonuclease subunit S n=1 Tax=Mitsuokella sp. TaxID=2049034 RepID=UPI003D7C620F
MMTKEMKKVPAIRFRDFTDEWEQRKLSDIAKIVGGGTPSTENIDYWDGDIDWYTPAEIGNKIFASGSVRKITENGLNNSSAKLLPGKKTVLFTSRAGIGNMAILEHDGATNQGFQSLVCNDDIEPYFIFSMKDIIKEKAERVAAGSTFSEISGKKLSMLEFLFPGTIEQKQIGNCFKSVDNLITLHQRKLDHLKKLKKYFLQNMFPAKGEKVPRIRFKGFTGDWEQRKLGDIAKFINGRAYAQNELLPSGKYKVLRVGNFYTNNSWYYSDLELDDKYYANDGDLLYTWSATFGPHIWRGDRVIYHYHIWKIDLTDKLEKRFAVQLLEQDKNDILFGHNGSAMAHITKKGMEQKKVIIPKSIWEQRQLGLFFDNLDNLITLHQRKLNQLLTMKKFMLQNLFI